MNFYQKILRSLPVNILIVGDSIGEGAGASTKEKTWYSILCAYLEKEYNCQVKLSNCSLGGNTSYAGYISIMEQEEGTEYDLAVICYGQNDDLYRFSVYYEAMIFALQLKYPECSILSILEASQQKYTEKIQTIQKICRRYHIPCVDMIAAFLDSPKEVSKLSDDGVHPNDMGQILYYRTIRDTIDQTANYGQMAPIINNVVPCSAMKKFEDLKKYPAVGRNGFQRIDPCSFLLRITEQGILGMDSIYRPGENQVDIYIDGKLWNSIRFIFHYDFSQRHIQTVSHETCFVEHEIKIVFYNKRQADGFGGIYFSKSIYENGFE